MKTSMLPAGFVCAVLFSLSGCAIEAQDSDELGESVDSTASALTTAQRRTAIDAKAAAHASLVGPPVTAYANTPNKPGGVRHYSNNASIYIGDAVGSAHIVLGLIRGKWATLGSENSVLGFPYTDEGTTAFNTGRYNLFQGGRILWKYGASQAFETHGCNDSVYGSLGFEWGTLGYPTSDETSITDRRKNNFERGRIYFRDNRSSTCDYKSWPVLTTTATSNQLAARGFPRITRLDVYANLIGADLVVGGAGFTPGALVHFYINNPGGRAATYRGIGARVAADGTFLYDSARVGDYVSNILIKKINDVLTVQAHSQGSGQMAVSSVRNLVVGANYGGAY